MREGRQFAGRQSQGARDYQEDSWGWHSRRAEDDDSPSGLLVVLADGMGGHRGGAHASAIAVDTFISAFAEDTEPAAKRLRRALQAANGRIREDSEGDDGLQGMGCTMLAANFARDGLHWISVGDSPLWLVRNGSLRRLNEDHSLAPLLQAQVERGELSTEEAAGHPQRNALRSALTGDAIELIDCPEAPLNLQPGDRIILASDGLETLEAEDIEAILAEDEDTTSADAADRLVAAVDERQRRGQDNITAVVVSPYQGVRDPTILIERPKAGGRRLAPILALVGLVAFAVLALWYFLAGPAGTEPNRTEQGSTAIGKPEPKPGVTLTGPGTPPASGAVPRTDFRAAAAGRLDGDQ